jgi:hypothetical protein
MSEWKPIETCPENVSVLFFIPGAEHYGEPIYRGIRVNMGTGERWHTSAFAMGRDVPHDYKPTHWIPLPAPPGSGDSHP